MKFIQTVKQTGTRVFSPGASSRFYVSFSTWSSVSTSEVMTNITEELSKENQSKRLETKDKRDKSQIKDKIDDENAPEDDKKHSVANNSRKSFSGKAFPRVFKTESGGYAVRSQKKSANNMRIGTIGEEIPVGIEAFVQLRSKCIATLAAHILVAKHMGMLPKTASFDRMVPTIQHAGGTRALHAAHTGPTLKLNNVPFSHYLRQQGVDLIVPARIDAICGVVVLTPWDFNKGLSCKIEQNVLLYRVFNWLASQNTEEKSDLLSCASVVDELLFKADNAMIDMIDQQISKDMETQKRGLKNKSADDARTKKKLANGATLENLKTERNEEIKWLEKSHEYLEIVKKCLHAQARPSVQWDIENYIKMNKE